MDFASYHLWSQFEPALGWEDSHCQMQRGWRWTQKSRRDESQIAVLTETVWQKVGKLAQQGIYEFHQEPLLLKHPRGSERVADRLYLYYEIAAVRDRVMQILQQYQAHPWLLDLDILLLNRGDELIPDPIEVRVEGTCFQLIAAFDCIVRSSDRQIQIVDFKTGLAEPDRRQAGVYLLACSYLYPDLEAVASFYNLETMTSSQPIAATPDRLAQTAHKLAQIAQLHQQQLQSYQNSQMLSIDCFQPILVLIVEPVNLTTSVTMLRAHSSIAVN
jgi:PD-(D/E)XK nuclease superfamily